MAPFTGHLFGPQPYSNTHYHLYGPLFFLDDRRPIKPGLSLVLFWGTLNPLLFTMKMSTYGNKADYLD